VNPSLDELLAGVRAGERLALARAITLVESRKPQDAPTIEALLAALHPHTGKAVRVGISGPPGAGKSTLIDALGVHLLGLGHKVAVLAVDPSSVTSGGSILGDKTRMTRLARDDRAFVRPSPGSGALGGVAPRTREAMAVCEGAGFDVILVETIGVGQSEVAVAGMVDCLLFLVLPDSGDELQGLKRGITELADVVFVNKADGDRLAHAQRTAAEYGQALGLLRGHAQVPVVVGAAATGFGVAEAWQAVRERVSATDVTPRRAAQARRWLEEALHDQLFARFLAAEGARARLQASYGEVERGEVTPRNAARRLLEGGG
jgi:LAO/AO transport system kinase